jgi:lactoylglutathione lyase
VIWAATVEAVEAMTVVDRPGLSMHDTDDALTIRELNHVALHVRDLDASIRFYGGVLGLPRLLRPNFSFDGAWFALGTQELHLIADPTHQADRKAFHFALRVKDAHAASAALSEKGITELRGPAPRPDGAVQVFLQDPDGHLIELVSSPLAERP